MKSDLHTLVERGLSLNDRIPDLKPKWNSHFEMMQEIGKVKLKSPVVTEDAVNININTIDATDASQIGLSFYLCKIPQVRWNIFLPVSVFRFKNYSEWTHII